MGKVHGVNAARIRWCCEMYKITLDDLSAQLKIAPSTIEEAMEGQPSLSVRQLGLIADFFGRGVLFFLETREVNETEVYTAQFRTLTNQKPNLSPKVKTLVERVEKQREIYISLLEDLGDEAINTWQEIVSELDLPSGTKNAASACRIWLGLGDTETFDSYRKAIEDKGVLAFVSNGYAGKWKIDKDNPVRGFSLYHASYPVIFVKKQRSDAPQSFTLMHELAHLLLHKGSFIDDDADFYDYKGKERTANGFAGNLLVPDSFLNQISLREFPFDKVDRYDDFLKTYRKRWCVSGEVILRRLLSEGLIKREAYQLYRRWRNSLPAPASAGGGSRNRYKEPLRVFGEPFVRTVFDALHDSKITLSKASTYLDNLKISDLRELERSNVHV